MKKIYFDMSDNTGCIGFIAKDVKVIPAGTTIYAMDIQDKNDYRKYADECDIHFIFEDNTPVIDFYSVPMVDVFATDCLGGLFGTIGNRTDLDVAAPICYIDKTGLCSLVADSLRNFSQLLALGQKWKTIMTPYNGVIFYKSREEARRMLDFISLPLSD